MKKLFLLLLLSAPMTISEIMAGTDTGGGYASRGTDTGGGVYSDLLEIDGVGMSDEGVVNLDANLSWCRSSVVVLEDAIREANRSFNKGKVVAANDRLVKGLTIASNSNRDQLPKQSLTRKAILRGIQLAIALDYRKIDRSREDHERVYLTLSHYVGFILTQVRQLDEEFFIPHFACKRGCDSFNPEKFEQKYVDYARTQLNWTNQELTYWESYYGLNILPVNRAMGVNGEYYVRGLTTHYTKALAVMVKAAREDLDYSFYAKSFSCIQDRLMLLQSDLERFNRAPNEDEFQEKENEFISRSTEVANSIRTRMCF